MCETLLEDENEDSLDEVEKESLVKVMIGILSSLASEESLKGKLKVSLLVPGIHNVGVSIQRFEQLLRFFLNSLLGIAQRNRQDVKARVDNGIGSLTHRDNLFSDASNRFPGLNPQKSSGRKHEFLSCVAVKGFPD